jgi:hypothetical protein
MWRHVVWYKFADVSEKRTASETWDIFLWNILRRDNVNISDYTALNGMITHDWRIDKDFEGSIRALLEVLSRNLPGGTDENHETRHSGNPVSRQRSESSISCM